MIIESPGSETTLTEIAHAAAPSPSLLNAFLAARDVPCPLCSYNLRDLAGNRCPECGNPLHLQVGLVEPRLGAYLISLAGGCVGLGGASLFTLIALRAAPRHWWSEPSGLLLLVLLFVGAAITTLMCLARRPFRRLSQGRQAFLAVAIWGCILLFGILISVTFK